MLIAHGRNNVNMLAEAMRYISSWVYKDYMKSGKDNEGKPFMRLKIVRSREFMRKYIVKRDLAEHNRLLKEAWLRRKKALEALHSPSVDPIYTFEKD